SGCLIVMNNSRVIPARTYGRRVSGGRVEVLYHGRERPHVHRVLMKSRAPLPAGERLLLPENWQCELLEPKQLDGSLVRIMDAAGLPVDTPELHAWLDRNGIMPLPPYIHRNPNSPDQ